MMNVTFNELNKTLEAKGIVYDYTDIPDVYKQGARLEAIYAWGFTVITSCNVLNDIITFYDNNYQAIVSLDIEEDTRYTLSNGILKVREYNSFVKKTNIFYVNLNNGAPVHVTDISAIGYCEDEDEDIYDKRFYALNDGRIYYKEDGKKLQLIEGEVNDFINEKFVLVPEDSFGSNVDALNSYIARM